jgi:hypothetical protein
VGWSTPWKAGQTRKVAAMSNRLNCFNRFNLLQYAIVKAPDKHVNKRYFGLEIALGCNCDGIVKARSGLSSLLAWAEPD